MADLFGGKWERENGSIGSDKFYVWADAIEDMPKDQIRRRFHALQLKFKTDISQSKDIWPPTLAFFLALDGNPRVNEQAYQTWKPKIMPHTEDEYKKMGKLGMEKLRKLIKH